MAGAGERYSCCSASASSLGQSKRTEVRTPDSTCSQWRGIFRGSYFRASKPPVDNLLLETSKGEKKQENITTDIASIWQYLLQF